MCPLSPKCHRRCDSIRIGASLPVELVNLIIIIVIIVVMVMIIVVMYDDRLGDHNNVNANVNVSLSHRLIVARDNNLSVC